MSTSFYSDTGGASVEHKIPLDKTIYFLEERDSGDSGSGTVAVDLTTGNKRKITLTGSPTLTFTDPVGPTNLIFRLVHGDAAVHTITWPATVKWPGGNTPTLSTGTNKVDIVALYFDGTNYYGNVSLNFS